MNCIICGTEYQQEHEHRPGLCDKCVGSVTDFEYTSALKTGVAAKQEPLPESGSQLQVSEEHKESDSQESGPGEPKDSEPADRSTQQTDVAAKPGESVDKSKIEHKDD